MAQKKGSTNFDAKLLVNYSKRTPIDERERTGFVGEARRGRCGHQTKGQGWLIRTQAGIRAVWALIKQVAREHSAWRYAVPT
jgi:hypothetical protein